MLLRNTVSKTYSPEHGPYTGHTALASLVRTRVATETRGGEAVRRQGGMRDEVAMRRGWGWGKTIASAHCIVSLHQLTASWVIVNASDHRSRTHGIGTQQRAPPSAHCSLHRLTVSWRRLTAYRLPLAHTIAHCIGMLRGINSNGSLTPDSQHRLLLSSVHRSVSGTQLAGPASERPGQLSSTHQPLIMRAASTVSACAAQRALSWANQGPGGGTGCFGNL